jgi:predicted kinase
LIHGYLGVGKTTLAKKLAAEQNAVRFSPDEWMTRLFGDDPPQETFWSRFDAIQAIIDELWPATVAAGASVVLDCGFWRRSFRDAVRERAMALGAEVQLIEVKCSDDAAWARIKRRNQDLQGSLVIVRDTYELLRVRFEPLGDDEMRTVVCTDPLD